MEEMLHHTGAVARGVEQAMVVGDMPFMSYQVSPQQAVESSIRLMKEFIEKGPTDDEVAAFLAVLFFTGTTPLRIAVAFALFRFFDAVKPAPVAWADAVFKGCGWRGAWGILFDDLVAAFCTLLVIALWRFV